MSNNIQATFTSGTKKIRLTPVTWLPEIMHVRQQQILKGFEKL
jgi:hypothetical protein